MVLGEGTRSSDIAGGARPATKRAKFSRTNNNKRSAAHPDNATNAGAPHHILFSQMEHMVEESDEDDNMATEFPRQSPAAGVPWAAFLVKIWR